MCCAKKDESISGSKTGGTDGWGGKVRKRPFLNVDGFDRVWSCWEQLTVNEMHQEMLH